MHDEDTVTRGSDDEDTGTRRSDDEDAGTRGSDDEDTEHVLRSLADASLTKDVVSRRLLVHYASGLLAKSWNRICVWRIFS